MDLKGYLKAERVWHRFLDKPETAHTAGASAATGIELSRITKNLYAYPDTRLGFVQLAKIY